MIRIREAILVEGRYDINVMKQLVDTIVLETGGFRIFNNKDQLKLLRRIAVARGLIILTDSDGAGFVIRNYLKGTLPKQGIKHAYIPDIFGKERRKRHASKEGKLGVEGMHSDILLKVLQNAGATFIDEADSSASSNEINTPITKADFFAWGLAGGEHSAERRQKLLAALDLPIHMTANALLEFINAVGSREEIRHILRQFQKND